MKVLWDPQVFVWQTHGGISRLFAELYRAFSTQDLGIEIVVPPWFGKNAYAADAGLPQLTFLPGKRLRFTRSLSRALNRQLLARGFRHAGPKLVHPTYYDPTFLKSTGKTPFVLTVHDMIHERYARAAAPIDGKTVSHKRQLLDRAARVIAISEATRRELLDVTDVDPAKVDVIHLGNSLDPIVAATSAVQRIRDRPYLLFIGQRGAYKNFESCLRGVAPLLTSKDLDLLCVGGGPFSQEERDLIRLLGADSRVVQARLTDEDLVSAYRGAELFVFPSFHEGFGLPLIEAFSCGCPVAASDIPVFREIAGDAAVYFDPGREDSIRLAVDQVLGSPSGRLRSIAAGNARKSQFSWSRCARETARSYRRAIGSG